MGETVEYWIHTTVGICHCLDNGLDQKETEEERDDTISTIGWIKYPHVFSSLSQNEASG
jgi:hypothetical protein